MIRTQIKKGWTVLLSLGTAAALAVAFHWNGYISANPGNQFDAWLLFLMGIAYGLSAVIMVARNESWPLRAHGQLLTFVADGALWGAVGMARLGWRRPITDWELTFVRAAFFMGAVCLIVGLLWLEIATFAMRDRRADDAH